MNRSSAFGLIKFNYYYTTQHSRGQNIIFFNLIYNFTKSNNSLAHYTKGTLYYNYSLLIYFLYFPYGTLLLILTLYLSSWKLLYSYFLVLIIDTDIFTHRYLYHPCWFNYKLLRCFIPLVFIFTFSCLRLTISLFIFYKN